MVFGDRALPAGGANVPLSILGDEFPTGWVGTPSFPTEPIPHAALIDGRRRIIANAWARSAYLYGPADSLRYLAADQWREGGLAGTGGANFGAACPYASCAALPTSLRDRTEVYAGWDYTTPEDVVYSNGLNRASARDTLAVPATGGDSMLFPGMHFRFYTGPAPTYPGTPRWSTLGGAALPRGEASGFAISNINLQSSVPAVRGYTNPLTLTAYERAMIVLIGGSSGHDSVTFYVDPAITRPHVEAWTQSGASYLYARCGQAPTYNPVTGHVTADWTAYVTTAGAVLDLTPGCTTWWRVVAVNASFSNVVMNVRVGASTSAARMYDLVVGTEAVPSVNERAYIRRVMRHGAWRFLGVTGGTHVVRTWTYNEGTCTGAHVCFRNRTSCTPVVNFTGGTPSWAMTFCAALGNIATGVTGTSPSPTQDAGILAHELGHLLTANGGTNQLWCEYWNSSDLNPVCGSTSSVLNLCEHSVMADTSFWRRLNTYCTASTHDRVGEVYTQAVAGGPISVLGSRSTNPLSSTGATVTECAGGGINTAGPNGQVAWVQLASTGAAPIAHPDWNPDNHSYFNFGDGSSLFCGRNL